MTCQQTNKMASSSSHTFVHQIQNLINWVDSDAQHLTKEELLDSIKIRVLVLAKKFIAFPHCQNFSLMQQAGGSAKD
jgi:hypothetical protein